ncbi:MAG: extracellular solute-binding protein [Planctomycetota bacterium]
MAGTVRRRVVFLVFAAVALASYLVFWHGREEALVVYCAHDAVYAQTILDDFQKRTGIPVAVRFDTEATKSLGLVELLVREKDAPRCDVFWNNEIFGTMDLKERGVLQSYKGPGWERIPAAFKDGEGYWTGFAARLRVYIVNTEKAGATEDAVERALAGEDLSRLAIAKPLYGTTLTQYSLLWDLWGPERVKEWHRAVRRRGLQELAGNGETKQAVAQGACDIAFTDTDDYFVARDAGKPVAMLPVRLENRSTICIPNTVAIIRGTRRREQAERLADYLLSEEVELDLARSSSRQIPLGPVPEALLPEEVRSLKDWARDGYALSGTLPARNACLEWLKSEYVK